MDIILNEKTKKYINANISHIPISIMAENLNINITAIIQNIDDVWKRIYKYEKLYLITHLSETMSISEIARTFRCSKAEIIDTLSPPKKQSQNNKVWTIDDDAYLTENWGYKPVESISRKLNRRVSCVRAKAKDLGLGFGIYNIAEMISFNEFCKILRKDYKRFKEKCKKLQLPFTTIKISTKRSYTMVSLEDCLVFLEKHQDIFNANDVGEYELGAEPDWLIRKRKLDKISIITKYTFWTTAERRQVRILRQQGKTYSEIAKIINRTESSVKSFAREANLTSIKPKKYEKYRKYLENQAGTKTYQEIADELNKTLTPGEPALTRDNIVDYIRRIKASKKDLKENALNASNETNSNKNTIS